MIHPKLTPERMRQTLVVVYPLPDGRAHATLLRWLLQFPAENLLFVHEIKTAIVCTRNTVLLQCRARAHNPYEEFLFIDGDVEITPSAAGLWDSDADVVCAKAEMQAEHAWDTPTAWHDPMWRCKAEVLLKTAIPYYEYTLDNLGTKELCCICQGFARKCRAAGFSVAVSGEVGHQNAQSWTNVGCREASTLRQRD